MGRFSQDISSRPGVTPTADMTVLPGVLGCRTLRRTVQQVRLESNPPAVARLHTLLHGLATKTREISRQLALTLNLPELDNYKGIEA
jgi:hypothetical protein